MRVFGFGRGERRRWEFAAVVAACLVAVGGTGRAEEVLVAAAADVRCAVGDVTRLFERRHPGVRVLITMGSTGMIAQQLLHGAPYDLFLAANVADVERLARAGVVDPASVVPYARGRLVLAWPRGAPPLLSLQDLLAPRIRRVAIAHPTHAPYGAAAKEALLAAGVWERLGPKLVTAENVSQVLTFLETGNVDAGLLAMALTFCGSVGSTLVDEALHAPIVQALAVSRAARASRLAPRFADLLLDEDGQAILARFGFLPPPGRAQP